MTDSVKFKLGQTVYFVAGEQRGILTGIVFRPSHVMYLVTWGNDLSERWHNECELSAEQSVSV
jgi:hypothetical protein